MGVPGASGRATASTCVARPDMTGVCVYVCVCVCVWGESVEAGEVGGDVQLVDGVFVCQLFFY